MEPTEEDRIECQKIALELGSMYYDQFLPYSDLLSKEGKFHSMDDDKRRRIEV